jgi:hypothetical protein
LNIILYQVFCDLLGCTSLEVFFSGTDTARLSTMDQLHCKLDSVPFLIFWKLSYRQVRFPVLLSPEEKTIAHDVCTMFGQAVCGFDLLRSNGRSYVCDVNGWSFVKNSYK